MDATTGHEGAPYPAPAARPHEPPDEIRARVLADIGSELRAPLHALLGSAQLMRLEGSLTARQASRLEAVLGAGTHVLEKVFSALDLSGADAERFLWQVDDADPADGAGPPEDEAATKRKLRVLIADDVAMNREIVALFLRAAGHCVTTAEGGAEAFVATSGHDFDVILMDVRMPVLDGLEATRRIRALPGPRGQTPIIALTALAHSEEIEACRKAGMNGHLAKPFRQDTLGEAILIATAAMPAQSETTMQPHPGARPRHGTGTAGTEDAAGSRVAMLNRARREAASNPSVKAALQSQLRSLAADREQLKSAAHAQGAASTWVHIESPWDKGPRNAEQRPSARTKPEAAVQFVLKLTNVGVRNGQRRLVDSKLSCVPPQDRDQHEFHWLLYVNSPSYDAGSFSTTCDLWRWNRSGWYSITAPGAAFSADEMFEQGWRYCGPCIDPVARVEVV